MKDNKYDKLKNEYKDKMSKAINNRDIEEGHYNCDDVLVALLLELGFDEIVEIYKTQDKWYA